MDQGEVVEKKERAFLRLYGYLLQINPYMDAITYKTLGKRHGFRFE